MKAQQMSQNSAANANAQPANSSVVVSANSNAPNHQLNGSSIQGGSVSNGNTAPATSGGNSAQLTIGNYIFGKKPCYSPFFFL